MGIENITYSNLGLIPTKCNTDGSSTNTGYSTDGGTHAEVSEELNNAIQGGFIFQDPQAQIDFSLRYFRIDLDNNTPYPGYVQSGLRNGGAWTIQWPGPHMMCQIEATVVCRDINQANYSYINTQTISFKHTLLRDAYDPDIHPGTHYQEFEVINQSLAQSTTGEALNPVLSTTSITDNFIEYNSSFNSWDFYITPYDSGLSNRMYVIVQGTYLLI